MEYPKSLFDKFELAVNELNDKDIGWHPFVFLRPQPHEFMDTAFVAKISLYYGPLMGAMWFLFLLIGGFRFDLGIALLCVVAGILAFFVIYRPTMAVLWNRRATRINETKRKRQGDAF